MENKIKPIQKAYIAITILMYWLIFWILPAYFLNPLANVFGAIEIINYITGLDLEGFVYYYAVVAPLFSVLPYKISKKLLPDFHYNIIFFVATIIIPFIFGFIYLFIYLPSMIDIGGSFGI